MGDMDGALLFHSLDTAYFSGTAQDGLVYVPKEGEPAVLMRRSLERASEESPLEVRPLKNMRNLRSDLEIPSGATIGLELDEYPVLGPLDHIIRSGMTVAVEPKIIYPNKGALGIEDTYLTTENGAQRLTRLPQEIWRV